MAAPPLVVVGVDRGIAIVTLNRPERYNAWTMEMMEAMKTALGQLGQDPEVQAAVLTGSGKYYCSGVDFAGAMQPMRPSTLKSWMREKNQALFEAFLDFPKPLVAAVNGPAIGASVTSAALCDIVIAAQEATFHTPFRALGITPEGCSSVNFPRLLGEANARVLLEEGRRVTATEARAMGLVSEVVEPSARLLERALEVAQERVSKGQPRRYVEDGGAEWHAALREANRQESIALANSFMERPFLEKQYQAAVAKGKTSAKFVFGALLTLIQTPLARL
jgi:enoyl-CoA hydratase/carnithine racemase